MNPPEGQVIVCANCGKPMDEDEEFWIITRYSKNPAIISCPECKKGKIILEYSSIKAKYKMIRDCTCPFQFSEDSLESLKSRSSWGKKSYHFCSKCFQDYPLKNVISVEVLGKSRE